MVCVRTVVLRYKLQVQCTRTQNSEHTEKSQVLVLYWLGGGSGFWVLYFLRHSRLLSQRLYEVIDFSKSLSLFRRSSLDESTEVRMHTV